MGIQPVALSVLFVVGVLIALYPAGASWLSQVQQSALISSYSSHLDEVSVRARAQLLDRARAYNDGLFGGASLAAGERVPSATDPVRADAGYWQQLLVGDSALMARIRIPTIDADLPVYHGTSDETLLRGVGHLQGTALPVGGAGTHAVLTAHRGLAEAALFTDLDRVRAGDAFTIEVLDEVLSYRVVDARVVEPEETESLVPAAGRDLVTLVTCTPLGINTQRILVTGERILPTPVDDLERGGTDPEAPGFPWWVLASGCALLLAVGYAALAIRRRRASRGAVPGTVLN